MRRVELDFPRFDRLECVTIALYFASVVTFAYLIAFVAENWWQYTVSIFGLTVSHSFLFIGSVFKRLHLMYAMFGRSFYVTADYDEDYYLLSPGDFSVLKIDRALADLHPAKAVWLKENDIVALMYVDPMKKDPRHYCRVTRYIGLRNDKAAMAYRLKWG